MPTIAELLILRQYDHNRQPQPDQVIFKIQSKKVGSIQNLVTISGKQKNGKTRYLAATIAAGITGKKIFDISLHLPDERPRIALFDTEQGDYDFYKGVKQIKDFCGTEFLPKTFDAFNVREDQPLNILKMIAHYLDNNNDCAVLFIDGLLDLLLDFNNVSESKKLTNYFKKITKEKNCLIIGVIHRGKGNDMTIGNIGSMADRMAQSVLKVEKNKDHNTYILSSDFMRSDEDFTPIEIWHNGHEWEQVPYISEREQTEAPVKPIRQNPQEREYQFHFEKVSEIFTTGELIRYEDLIQDIKEVYSAGRNWAIECIKHLKSINLIYRTSAGYTNSNKIKMNL